VVFWVTRSVSAENGSDMKAYQGKYR
jgi:hypothetical protein